MRYLSSHEQLMDALLRHIDSHSIMDVLLAITWDAGIGEKPLRDLSFFHEHGLVPKLVAKFDPSEEVRLSLRCRL